MTSDHDGRRTVTVTTDGRQRFTRRRALQVLAAVGGVATGLPTVGASDLSDTTDRSRIETGWTQQQKLVAGDGDGEDQFGIAMAVDGSTALIGANNDDDPNGAGAGSAYVFERSDGTWTQQAKLAPDDGDSDDFFGQAEAVALDGSRAVVGAPRDEDPNGEGAGAAYVFERSDGTWTQQTKIAPDDGDSNDEFGDSVALDGSTIVIGAPFRAGDDAAGAAYVFERTGGTWTQRATFTADNDNDDNFGFSVALDGSTTVIGADREADPNGEGAGAAYVFERSGDTWSRMTKLTPDDGDSNDRFGLSVALDGSTALVGAIGDEDPNGTLGGSAYVFERSDGTWSQQAKLTPDDGDARDLFGNDVALDGSTAVIGARNDEDPNGEGEESFSGAGSAYVFERTDDTWTQQVKLVPDDGDGGDGFGVSIAVDESTALIGALGEEDPNGVGAGATYVFTDEGAAVRFRPTTPAVPLDNTRTVQVVGDAPRGLSSFRLSVSVATPSAVRITDLRVLGGAGFTSVNVADDGTSATGAGINDGRSGSDLPLLAVTLRGESLSDSTLTVTAEEVTDADGTNYGYTGQETVADVREDLSGVDVTGDGAPSQDVDGDGRHEDIDGDGDFDTSDVQAMLDDLVSGDDVTNNPGVFDFTGDGSVGTGDVQALLDELVGR